ncbi:MAG: hypothetical protein M3Q80_01300 [bacterium]|nr:hypothetical protein [bacterium]
MEITFLPYSDIKDYSQAIKEYEEIWNTWGTKIIQAWEKELGFTFEEKKMVALIWSGISHCPPLCLRDDYEFERRKSVITHEIGHLLLNRKMKKVSSLEVHKTMYLVLYDIFCNLYGKEYADSTVLLDNEWSPMYKEAWEYALSFKTREERKAEFEKIKLVMTQ